VVIDCDILREIPGGVAAVSVVVPLRGESVSEYAIVSSKRCPAAILFDGRKVVEKWSTKNISHLPAINIQILASAPNHLVCTASLLYSSIEYFRDKGYDFMSSYRLAEKDPLALFKYGGIIGVSKRNTFVSCTNISRLISEIDSLVKKSETSKLSSHKESVSRNQYIEKINPMTTCAPYTRIWWSDLYNQQDNPPQEWLQRIINRMLNQPDPNVAKYVWRQFAYYFSIEWVYPSPPCSKEEAEYNFYSDYVLPSFYPRTGINHMDWLIWKYAGDSGWDWRDIVSEGTKIDTRLGVGVEVINYGLKRYGVVFSFSAGPYGENKVGITIFGSIFLGWRELRQSFGGMVDHIPPYYIYAKSWIYLPTTLESVGDGYAFFVDEYKECTDPNRCNYVFRPIITFIPLYTAYINYSAIQITNINDPDPMNLSELGRGFEWIQYSQLINSDCGKRIYYETNVISGVTGPYDYGAFITSLVYTWLGPILAVYGSTLASVLGSIAMGSVSFTWAIYGQTLNHFQLAIETAPVCEPATVNIYKFRMRYISDYYTVIGNVPYMIIRIEII
jgi:hypothetical protein